MSFSLGHALRGDFGIRRVPKLDVIYVYPLLQSLCHTVYRHCVSIVRGGGVIGCSGVQD